MPKERLLLHFLKTHVDALSTKTARLLSRKELDTTAQNWPSVFETKYPPPSETRPEASTRVQRHM